MSPTGVVVEKGTNAVTFDNFGVFVEWKFSELQIEFLTSRPSKYWCTFI